MKHLAVLLLLAALPAGAATFLVSDDAALVGASKAIVLATAGESRGRFGAGGWIGSATARGQRASADYVLPAAKVAAISINASSPPASTYCLLNNNRGIRWSTFPSSVVFLSHGTQPGALNGGLTAIQRGLASWTNDPS